MSATAKTTTSRGIGLPGLTFIVFLILKLTNTIDWSWWWVTAPLWVPVAFVALIFVGICLVACVKALAQ